MSNAEEPTDVFYDDESENSRKLCVKIEMKAKFPKLMKLRGDFKEFKDLSTQHPIHYEFTKMLDDLPALTLEALYCEV